MPQDSYTIRENTIYTVPRDSGPEKRRVVYLYRLPNGKQMVRFVKLENGAESEPWQISAKGFKDWMRLKGFVFKTVKDI